MQCSYETRWFLTSYVYDLDCATMKSFTIFNMQFFILITFTTGQHNWLLKCDIRRIPSDTINLLLRIYMVLCNYTSNKTIAHSMQRFEQNRSQK